MRTAHVRCGDDLRETLGPAGFRRRLRALHGPGVPGPGPRTADPAEFDAVRAEWLARAYDLDAGTRVRERLSQERAALDTLDTLRPGAAVVRARLVRPGDPHPAAGPAGTTGPRCTSGCGCSRSTRSPARTRSSGSGSSPRRSWRRSPGRSGRSARTSSPPRSGPGRAERAGPDRAWPGSAARRCPTCPVRSAGTWPELPWTTDGLSLSERLCLRAVSAGPLPFPARLPGPPGRRSAAVSRRRHAAAGAAAAARRRAPARWPCGTARYQLTAYGQRSCTATRPGRPSPAGSAASCCPAGAGTPTRPAAGPRPERTGGPVTPARWAAPKETAKRLHQMVTLRNVGRVDLAGCRRPGCRGCP